MAPGVVRDLSSQGQSYYLSRCCVNRLSVDYLMVHFEDLF